MIITGTMNLTRTIDQGNFYCPSCRTTQTYRRRSRRPFLTVYFIPTVPVGRAEEFVQCDQCKDCWDVTVLEIDREQRQQLEEDQFSEQALRSAILVVLADGVTSDREISALQGIAAQLLGRSVDREELGWLCSRARENRIIAKNYVLTVSRRWNQQQRLIALGAMFLAATAEGDMGDVQLKLLTEMRDVLDLSDSEYQAAIERAMQWETV